MTPPAAGSAARAATPRSVAPARSPKQPQRRPLRVAPEPRRFELALRGVRPGRVGTIAGVLLFVALFALASFQTVIIKSQGQIDATADRITEQETLQRSLEYEVAELKSPQRVADAAADLGMITPGLVTYLQPAATDELQAALDPGTPPGETGVAGSTAP